MRLRRPTSPATNSVWATCACERCTGVLGLAVAWATPAMTRGLASVAARAASASLKRGRISLPLWNRRAWMKVVKKGRGLRAGGTEGPSWGVVVGLADEAGVAGEAVVGRAAVARGPVDAVVVEDVD